MASVLNSKAKFYRSDPRNDNEADHFIESEADIFIKELSYKQLRTTTSLEEQLNQKKEFLSSHSYQPLTEKTSGTLTYHDFKRITTDVETDKISAITTDSYLSKNVSRHMRELAFAVKPNSTETKLLEFAISCNTVGEVKPDTRPAEHPINHLQEFENELFGHLSETTDTEKIAKTILRKRRQLLEAASERTEIQSKPNRVNEKSLWDVNDTVTSANKRLCRKVYSCQKEKLFTIRDNKIVPVDDNASVESMKSADVNQNVIEPSPNHQSGNQTPTRLSVDEIRKLPKFQNYQKGNPSKTLYLKNLLPRMTEDDLSALFSEFQLPDQPRILYNLMKSGKMRGQAFVHFHNVETAEKALGKLNGWIVQGKPLIIQFSSSKM